MIVYHGTTLKYARQIERVGLQSRTDLAFDVFNEWQDASLREIEGKSLVCVTTRRETAIDFAEFRVKYERAKRGERIFWGMQGNVKLADRRDARALPALVTFILPEDWPLEADLGSAHQFQSFCGSKPIPAQYVYRVEKLFGAFQPRFL